MKKQKGITLIGLVITIIIIIVLCGITLNLLIGDKGIIIQAIESKEITEIANLTEEAQMVKMSSQITAFSNRKNAIQLKRNKLLSDLHEHFEDSIRKNNKIIISGGKYDVIVEKDLTIKVEKHQDTDGIIQLDYDIYYQNNNEEAPAWINIYAYLENENGSYYEYAEKILTGKSEEEQKQIFVEGQNYWNKSENWGEPIYKNFNELMLYWSENFCNNSFSDLEGMLEYYNYDSLYDFAIDWQYVKPEEYFGMTYKQYAQEILEGENVDSIKEIFVNGQNYWNSIYNEEPIYKNFDELMLYWSENFCNNSFSDLEGMLEYYNYDSLYDFAIDWWNVEPKEYFSSYGIMINCSNGQKVGTTLNNSSAEFYIEENGKYTFEAEGPNGENAEIIIAIGPQPEFGLNIVSKHLKIGDTLILETTNSEEIPNNEIIWTTSDNRVVTVENGLITAVGEGTAIIEAKNIMGKTAFCEIIVENENIKFLDIATCEDLVQFAQRVNSGENFNGWVIRLINDLDFTGTEYSEWDTIGYSPLRANEEFANAYFDGTFDGEMHTIKGLNITQSTRCEVGLFGNNTGLIKNLKMKDCYITRESSYVLYVGTICAYNSGTIINCVAESNINVIRSFGSSYDVEVGGIVGANNGTVEKCYNYGNIDGEDTTAGGIVGSNTGIIKKCINYGSLGNREEGAKVKYFGGVVGENFGTVEESINEGELIIAQGLVAGICGVNREIVKKCINKGSFLCTYDSNNIAYRPIIAALCGRVLYSGVLEDCYNIGNISFEQEKVNYSVCGMVYEVNSEASVKNCYTVCQIKDSSSFKNLENAAFMTEMTKGTISNCYYNSDLCSSNEEYAQKYTTAQMKDSIFVTTLGNSFKIDENNINNGYPILDWE